MKHRKFKFLTILLVSLMLMGSMPVMAAQEQSAFVGIPTNVSEIKRAIPQAKIVEYADDFEAYSIVNGEVQYNIDSLNPESVPTETYFREVEDGNYTLYVYEDGSFNILTSEFTVIEPLVNAGAQTRGTGTDVDTGDIYVGTFTYTGTSTQKIQFKMQYYDDESVFDYGPYSRTVTPWGTYSYGAVSYGMTNSNTRAYVSAKLRGVTYNEMGNPMTYDIATHKLTAYRNGTNRPYCSFSS